jgi:HEAT repeat protein
LPFEEFSMTEPSQTTPSGNGGNNGPLYAPETGFSLFLKLFIVPAAIVAVALGIFLLGTLAIQHPKSAQEYLEELRSDSTSRRWQAAYELSRMLNQGENIQFDSNLRADLVKTFVEAKKDDPRVREYLALVLGRMKEKTAVPALSDAVGDESSDVKIYSLWALGNIEDPAGGPAALQALSDPDPEVERMAVGAVSALRYEPAKNALEANLTSSNEGLKYDSAVALARIKDTNAIPTLLEMMNLKATGQPGDEIIQSAKIAALEGAPELNDAGLHSKMVDLSKNDPDLKVREAAMDALKK